MIKNCKYCKKEFESPLNLNPYCSTLCRSKDKFIIIEGDKKFKVWKKNYEKYPDFYNSIKSYKDRNKNKCFSCGNIFENFSMCCSKECSIDMKKQSTLITTGSTHNLSKDSKSRKNMTESLMINYGVDNVYKREDVKNKLKETWILKYGYTNPSKVDYIKNKKRSTSEKNGFWTPKELMTERKIYEENVMNVTWFQLKKFGNFKFGNNLWELIKESRKKDQKKWLTIDHRISKNEGFIKKISPMVIGHICNLDLMEFQDNREKWMNSSITLDLLLSEIEDFEKKINFIK
jgi:hypothetical protein